MMTWIRSEANATLIGRIQERYGEAGDVERRLMNGSMPQKCVVFCRCVVSGKVPEQGTLFMRHNRLCFQLFSAIQTRLTQREFNADSQFKT
jgi:hypothetical protein